MEDEYLSKCIIDASKRTVVIYSNEGDEKEEEKPFGGSPTSGAGSSSYFPILRKLIDFG